MRRFLALLSAFVLVSSVSATSVAAAPAPRETRTNSFVGSFDIVEGWTGRVAAHVVAQFKEPTFKQLVPGTLDIYWSPDTTVDPYEGTGVPFSARESHAQVLRAAFWRGDGQTGSEVDGYLCDYDVPNVASCHPFQMGFFYTDPAAPRMVAFEGVDQWCCNGIWYDVGPGKFELTYFSDTPNFPWYPPPSASPTSLTAPSGATAAVPTVTASTAQATTGASSFVGNFDLLDYGSPARLVGHVVAQFKKPTLDQLVPGSLDISWAPVVADTGIGWPPVGIRESHARLLSAWFSHDGGAYTHARVQGLLCDYLGPQNASCHGFQMDFAANDDPKLPQEVGFGPSETCCTGPFYVVGKGAFDLAYVLPTAQPFLTSHGTELSLGGQPFHELSFDKYDLLYQFVQPGGAGWGFDGAAAAIDALRILGQRGYRVVRVATSPYAASWFDEVFFDPDSAMQAVKRQRFFAGFDAMLDAADRNDIRIVADLMWNVANLGELGGHSVREGMTSPESLGRQRVDEYIREVVTRYATRSTIAMWELGNEYALGADLQSPPFDYTSDDLVAYYEQTSAMIRAIDGDHLITTGDSSPRSCAMHLRRAALAGSGPDWTADSAEELTGYLRLINPDPIDVISIHYMDDAMVAAGGSLYSPENLRLFARVADEIGKPLFVGEIGAVGYPLEFTSYNSEQALDMMRATVPVLVELKLPLTLYWTFMNGDPNRELSLKYGVTDEALRLIDQASRQVRR